MKSSINASIYFTPPVDVDTPSIIISTIQISLCFNHNRFSYSFISLTNVALFEYLCGMLCHHSLQSSPCFRNALFFSHYTDLLIQRQLHHGIIKLIVYTLCVPLNISESKIIECGGVWRCSYLCWFKVSSETCGTKNLI